MSCSGPMSGGGIPAEITEGGRMIRRKAYTRHSFTRKSGIHVRGSRVTAKRILDRGAPGKWATIHGPGIGPLKEGALTSVGYSAKKSKTARHKSIRKAVRKYGALSTFRKLQAISTYTKRTSKGKSRTYKADRNWVRKTFM